MCSPGNLLAYTTDAITGRVESFPFDKGMLGLIEQQMEGCLLAIQEILHTEGVKCLRGLSFPSFQRAQSVTKILAEWAWCVEHLNPKLLGGATKRWKHKWISKLRSFSPFA